MTRFEAEVAQRGPALVVEIPFDVRAELGRVRAPVRVTVSGHAFRTTSMRYGGVDYLGFNKQVQAAAGVRAGERITIDVTYDDEPRVVEVPAELADALALDVAASEAFGRLSYTHRREYAQWISEAKRNETRARRAEKAIAMLRDGVKNP